MAGAVMDQAQAKNQGGRPTDYTPELAEEICDELTEGKSLRSICKEPGMPHRGTVGRWLDSHTAFAAKYARARLSQADLMDDRILETIAKIESGELTPEQGRVIIAALQWRAAKLEPKKYGDKQHVALEVGPSAELVQFWKKLRGGEVVETLTPETTKQLTDSGPLQPVSGGGES